MPLKDSSGKVIDDHNLLNLTDDSFKVSIEPMTGEFLTLGNSIRGKEVIIADEAEFGNLKINGKIRSDQIELSETEVILNIDYDKITKYMENMGSDGLEFFINHLNRLKLMAEKELFDRS